MTVQVIANYFIVCFKSSCRRMSTCDDGLPSEGQDGAVQPGSSWCHMILYVCSRLPQLRPGPIDHVEEDTCSQLNSGALLGVGPHPGSVTYIFAYICCILVHVLHMCKDRTIMRHKFKVMPKWHHPTGPQDIEAGESHLERRTSQRAQHHQK